MHARQSQTSTSPPRTAPHKPRTRTRTWCAAFPVWRAQLGAGRLNSPPRPASPGSMFHFDIIWEWKGV